MSKLVKSSLFKLFQDIKYNKDLNDTLNILPKVAGNSVFDRKLVKRLVVSYRKFKPHKTLVYLSTKLLIYPE